MLMQDVIKRDMLESIGLSYIKKEEESNPIISLARTALRIDKSLARIANALESIKLNAEPPHIDSNYTPIIRLSSISGDQQKGIAV